MKSPLCSFEFRRFVRSRQQQQEFTHLCGDDLYLHAYKCVLVCQYCHFLLFKSRIREIRTQELKLQQPGHILQNSSFSLILHRNKKKKLALPVFFLYFQPNHWTKRRAST